MAALVVRVAVVVLHRQLTTGMVETEQIMEVLLGLRVIRGIKEDGDGVHQQILIQQEVEVVVLVL
jgi:hypothetical protein